VPKKAVLALADVVLNVCAWGRLSLILQFATPLLELLTNPFAMVSVEAEVLVTS
jgi:hypothetical protein